jgi:hypothetical protein
LVVDGHRGTPGIEIDLLVRQEEAEIVCQDIDEVILEGADPTIEFRLNQLVITRAGNNLRPVEESVSLTGPIPITEFGAGLDLRALDWSWTGVRV